MMAGYTCTGTLPTDTTDFLEPRTGDRGNPFCRDKGIAGPELDLRSPDSTGDMNPVVVGRSLQGFSWVDRPI